MFRETILNIIQSVWPMLVIISMILVTLRVTYLITTKTKFVFYKEMLFLLFIIYIISLFHTVTFQDVNWSTSNFIPFKEMFRYRLGSNLFMRNVIGNVLMFLPYGFFIRYFLREIKPKTAFILVMLLSITIEITQACIGRVFDVDDILLNIMGGMLGYFIFLFLERCRDHFPKVLKKVWFYNVIIASIVLFMILYLVGVIPGGLV